MRYHNTLLSLGGAVLMTAVTFASHSALAQAPAAPQADRAAQEAACSGDATRFCGEVIPDEQKIAACLRANRTKISPACQAMLR